MGELAYLVGVRCDSQSVEDLGPAQELVATLDMYGVPKVLV